MSNLKKQIHRMLHIDLLEITDLPRGRRLGIQALQMSIRMIMQFIEDRCIQRASALAYASLLAIVPLVILAFSIFSSFQAFETLSGQIQSLIVEYFVPTSQHIVMNYLGSMSGKATSLSIFGFLGLLITTTALLTTMEEAFNDIWRIREKRSQFSRFITFWALLTLSPMLMGASISITSYFAALPMIHHVAESASLLPNIPFLIPWLISSSAMTALYITLPNTTVVFRYALISGLIAGALFELGKLSFAFYVTELANYERLYGVLGTLPIFLIWLYLTWVIVLLGAEINYGLQHGGSARSEQQADVSMGEIHFIAHLILWKAATAFQQGEAVDFQLLKRVCHINSKQLHALLHTLSEKKLLQPIMDIAQDNPAWMLGMDSQNITLQAIHDAVHGASFSAPKQLRTTPFHPEITRIYGQLQNQQDQILSQHSLSDFIQKIG